MEKNIFFNKRTGPLPLRINSPTSYITSTNKQLEKIDPKFVELTADVLKIFSYNVTSDSVSIWNRGFVSHRGLFRFILFYFILFGE